MADYSANFVDGEPQPTTGAAEIVDVTNAAHATRWLQHEIGLGKLAGFFRRDMQIVHTPCEGEKGYMPLTDGDDNSDGVAQIRVINKENLAAEVQFSYHCTRTTTVGRGDAQYEVDVDAMFPLIAAQTVVNAPHHLPNLRALRDVVHTPMLRMDGTILETPGYDAQSKMLYIPSSALQLRPIPDKPTVADMAESVALIMKMISGFRFESEHDRANYIGMLLTPFIRPLVPAPFKLGVINAHQPGSGKTYLASALRTIHGGVFRSEMPENDAELRKQITSILMCTTSPIIHIDNVTGLLRSSTLAGLLSQSSWDDRPLGSTKMVSTKNNRLWIITGNNVALGGDLPRRAIWCTIDPGIPNPHLRRPEDFDIPNFEQWVRSQRGELIRAALIIIRSWLNMNEMPKETATDSYARWSATIQAILAHAGISGTFDSPMTDKTGGTGADDEEWATLLEHIFDVLGDRHWTVNELLDEVYVPMALGSNPQCKKVALDKFPETLAKKIETAARNGLIQTSSRSLGKWLGYRAGRWAEGYTVKKSGKRDKQALWHIEKYIPKMDN